MPGPFTYTYETHDGDRVVATGRLTFETELAVGDRITIGRSEGRVERIEPTLGGRERRLVVRLG